MESLSLPEVLRSFPKQAADLSDLLQGWYDPLVVGAQLLDEAVYPLDLLGVSVLLEHTEAQSRVLVIRDHRKQNILQQKTKNKRFSFDKFRKNVPVSVCFLSFGA